VHLHRKGACPAPGPDAALAASPFRFTGHPVIIPGSMGAASYLLAGEGNDLALCSACHGAGRSLSRGKSRHVDERTYEQTFERLRVVTPIDPTSPQVRLRRDVLAEYHDRLKEEAPYAYKDITPVVQTVEDAKVARRVARLWPLLTIKG
jgi:tRNA-splicing ligase RtcB